MTIKTTIAGFFIAAALPLAACAHGPETPKTPEPDQEVNVEVEKRGVIRIKSDEDGTVTERVIRWTGEDMPMAIEEFRAMIEDSEITEEIISSVSEFADKIEVERDEEHGTAVFFNDDEMVRVKRMRKKVDDDALHISGLGRNLTLERETIIEDGKTRTRIVIEMDGGDEIDIRLPKHTGE